MFILIFGLEVVLLPLTCLQFTQLTLSEPFFSLHHLFMNFFSFEITSYVRLSLSFIIDRFPFIKLILGVCLFKHGTFGCVNNTVPIMLPFQYITKSPIVIYGVA